MATFSMVTTGGAMQMVVAKPLASLTLNNGCTRLLRTIVSSSSSSSLHSSFLSAPLSLSSSFSGLSLGLDLAANLVNTNRCRRLVVKAGKAALCQTKRNRSRKSLARTHGFRVRMSTTSGRAVLKRRRAKGRKVLCTKTNPTNGKRVKV